LIARLGSPEDAWKAPARFYRGGELPALLVGGTDDGGVQPRTQRTCRGGSWSRMSTWRSRSPQMPGKAQGPQPPS